MRFVLVFTFLLLLSSGAAQVLNGWEARRGEFPYAVQVHDERPHLDLPEEGNVNQYLNRVTCRCTGVITKANFVLTAAHCVVDEDSGRTNYDTWIVAGDVLSRRFKEKLIPHYHVHVKRNADDVIPHGEFNNPPVHSDFDLRVNDVALLYFADPLPVDRHPFVRSIAIGPWDDSEPGRGAVCKIMGWGVTRQRWFVDRHGNRYSEDYDDSDRLLWGETTILQDRAACRTGDYFNGEYHYCVGGGEQHALKGDSGGPLVCAVKGTDRLYGTLIGNYLGDTVNYYARLMPYAGWMGGVERSRLERKDEVVEVARIRRAEREQDARKKSRRAEKNWRKKYNEKIRKIERRKEEIKRERDAARREEIRRWELEQERRRDFHEPCEQ